MICRLLRGGRSKGQARVGRETVSAGDNEDVGPRLLPISHTREPVERRDVALGVTDLKSMCVQSVVAQRRSREVWCLALHLALRFTVHGPSLDRVVVGHRQQLVRRRPTDGRDHVFIWVTSSRSVTLSTPTTLPALTPRRCALMRQRSRRHGATVLIWTLLLLSWPLTPDAPRARTQDDARTPNLN